jgi:hypothetical protein
MNPSAHSEVNAKTLESWERGEREYPRWWPESPLEEMIHHTQYFHNSLEVDARAYAEFQVRKFYARDER